MSPRVTSLLRRKWGRVDKVQVIEPDSRRCPVSLLLVLGEIPQVLFLTFGPPTSRTGISFGSFPSHRKLYLYPHLNSQALGPLRTIRLRVSRTKNTDDSSGQRDRSTGPTLTQSDPIVLDRCLPSNLDTTR